MPWKVKYVLNDRTGEWEMKRWWVDKADRVPDTALEIVADKYRLTQGRVDEAYYSARAEMELIQNFLTNLQPLEIFTEFNKPTFERLELARSDQPEAPTLTFPEFTVPDIDTPVPGFNYHETPYSSYLQDRLRARLLDGVDNGGTGLGADVEEALFERDRLRREQARRDSIDRIQAEWASDLAGDIGLPDNSLAALYQVVEVEHIQKDQTVSFDIAAKMAELARQQQEVFIKSSVELESVTTAKHSADQARALEAAKTEPEIILKGVEVALAKVKVMGEVYNALAAKANAQAQIFKSQMDGWMGGVDAGAKELAASTQKYEADGRIAGSESEAHSRTDVAIIEQIKNFLMLRMEGLKSLAQLSANMTAALATSVSASASIGHQESIGTSDSTTTTDANNITNWFQHDDYRNFI